MVGPAPWLALLILAVVQQEESEELEEAVEATTRSHDLRRILAIRGALDPPFDLCLHPVLWRNDVGDLDGPTTAVDGDEIVEFLHQTCAGGSDEVELEISDALVLRVTAPTEVQERISRALAGIEQAMLGEERLEVRVFAGEGLLDAPMLEPTADADRRIEKLLASGRTSLRRRGATALRELFFTAIHDVTAQQFVHDYEIEISHGAVIHDPVELELRTGLESIARATRTGGGTWLDLAIRHSEPAAAPRELTLRPKVWFASDWPHELEDPHAQNVDVRRFAPAVFHGEVPLKLELPYTRTQSWAGSFLLPDGQSLWIPASATTKGDGAEDLPIAFEIRVVGPLRPAHVVLNDIADDGRPVALHHVAAFGNEGFASEQSDASTFRSEWIDAAGTSSAWPSVVASRRLSSELDDRVKNAAFAISKAEIARLDWRFLSLDLLAVHAPSPACERMGEQLEQLSPLAAAVELSGRLTRDGKTVADFRMPATTGRRSILWSGVVGESAADWDVDVANEALVANPLVIPWFDGAELQCTVNVLHDGRAQIVVDGMVNLLDGPPELESLLTPYTPVFERVRAQRLPLHETRNVVLAEGRASARFGGEPLALELSIRLLDPEAAARRNLQVRGLSSSTGGSNASLDLCPARILGEGEEDPPWRETPLDVDLLEEVVAEFVGSEVKERDPTVQLHGGRLRIAATEPVLEVADRVLALLERACLGEEQLEVAVVAGAQLPEMPLVLDAAECDRRVAELVRSGNARIVKSGSAALEDSLATTFAQLAAVTHMTDYEVEIAHGAVIHDPSLVLHEPGLEVSARGARATDATLLDLAVRFVDPEGRFRELVPRPTVWFSTPVPPLADPADPDADEPRGPSLFNAEIPLRIEYANSHTLAFATSLLLPNGSAAWIPLRVESHAGAASCAIVAKVHGPFRPVVHAITSPIDDELELAVVDVGAWRTAGFEASPMASITIESHFLWDLEPWWPSLAWTVGRGAGFADLARNELQPADPGAASFVMPLSEAHLAVHSTPAVRARVLERLAEAFPLGRPIEISGRVTRAGKTVGEFRFPAMTDKLATCWAGLKGSYLPDWDVEVAGEAAVGNPECGNFLDGVALRFVARAAGDDALQLTVTGVLNLLDGPPEIVSIEAPYTPIFENVEARRLFIDETRNLHCKDRVAAASFGSEDLGLEVTVRLR